MEISAEQFVMQFSTVPLLLLAREFMFRASAGAILYFARNYLIFRTSKRTPYHSRELSRTVWAVHMLPGWFLSKFHFVVLCVTPPPAANPWRSITQS